MNQNPREIIIMTLEIVGFQGDKEEFTEQFIAACKKQAVINLIRSLSTNEQEEFKNKLSDTSDEKEIAQIFSTFFNEEAYNAALNESTEETFKKYLELVFPNLNGDQKEELKKLLDTLLPPAN